MSPTVRRPEVNNTFFYACWSYCQPITGNSAIGNLTQHSIIVTNLETTLKSVLMPQHIRNLYLQILAHPKFLRRLPTCRGLPYI